MSGKDLEGLCYGNLGPALGSGLKPGLNPRITPPGLYPTENFDVCEPSPHPPLQHTMKDG
jgi:hypothetical protein